jgi:hypothetical protein
MIPFMIHSTFRDHQGRKLVPYGLEWGLPGISYHAFVPSFHGIQDIDLESTEVRRGIVEAYNRWCFAKDLPFHRVEDIAQISKSDHHVHVQWNHVQRDERHIRNQDIKELIKLDDALNGGPPAEVWINGDFVSILTPDTLHEVLEAVARIQSVKVCFKRSEGMIRIEKYFRGMIRAYQVFDHLMDNLYALEDPEILNDSTIIGTATLPDWIMGGNLTSRLWVQQTPEGDILTLRPLREDDVSTSDRTYRLVKGQDDDKIAIMTEELTRLRHLSSLPSPVAHSHAIVKQAELESERARQHRLNRKKKFGL